MTNNEKFEKELAVLSALKEIVPPQNNQIHISRSNYLLRQVIYSQIYKDIILNQEIFEILETNREYILEALLNKETIFQIAEFLGIRYETILVYIKQNQNIIDKVFEEEGDINVENCSFCYQKISIIVRTSLKDGRKRCSRCSKTTPKKEDDIARIKENVISNMQRWFNISLPENIILKIDDHINDGTPHWRRLLGDARKTSNGNYKVRIESGTPKLNLISTLVHELTHVWQLDNWDYSKLIKTSETLIEGMATWTQIQYLYFSQEKEFSKYIYDTVMKSEDPSDPYKNGLIIFEKLLGFYSLPYTGRNIFKYDLVDIDQIEYKE